jgi:hypothetical protein
VTFLEHRREAGGFLFAAFSRARFFETAVQPDLHERLFAIEFLFKAADRLFRGSPFRSLISDIAKAQL